MKVKSWNTLSIQTFIALAYAIVIVVLISVIGIISFFVTSRTVDENTNEYVFQLVEQINYDIEAYVRNVENTMNSVVADDDVIEYFSVDIDEAKKRKTVLGEDLSGYMDSRSDIINIILFREDGEIALNNSSNQVKRGVAFKEESWYKDAINSETTVISNSHIQNIIVNQYKWVVSWSTKIIDQTTGELLGIVLVDLNFNLIDDMLSNLSLGEKGYMFIIDNEGDIIYHPKHELIYSGIRSEAMTLLLNSEDGYVTSTEDGRVKNYIVSTSEYTGWKVVGAVYEDELKPYDEITKQIYFLMSGLAIVLAVLISIVISRSYLHPIKDLSLAMEKFKNGNLDTRVEVGMKNEFGELADDFNDMTIQIKRLIQENQHKEKAKRKFELKSLQSQINPHFLYNTLDSIVWMAEAGMNDDVVKMTVSLSKLFRISINRGSEFVTLAQEIEHIESYLAIQKIRYGEKLDYEIKIDENLMSYRVIKIVIQPIVENAIYHGIKKLSGPGKISIVVREVDENITMDITDNGVGMDEAMVKELLNKDDHNSAGNSGVGVKNVDQRIKLYYGDDYGVSITSAVFEGTTVTLTIPKEYHSKEVTDEKA